MPGELERAVVGLVREVHGGRIVETPAWLQRPGRSECRRRWLLIQKLYRELTGQELPESMPPRERRTLDAVLVKRGHPPRVLEVDESQHFNLHRATTLRLYPRSIKVAFPRQCWIERSVEKKRLEGGGFGRPCPPLFPGAGGRHLQRAFRDALADIVPLAYGWLPTLRIADFEVAAWIGGVGRRQRMEALLSDRLR